MRIKEAMATVHQEWDSELKTYGGRRVSNDKLQGEATGLYRRWRSLELRRLRYLDSTSTEG